MFHKDRRIKNYTRRLYLSIFALAVFTLTLISFFKFVVFEQDEIAEYQLRVRPKLSTLAINPNWNELKYYQKTITKKKISSRYSISLFRRRILEISR